MVGDGRKLAWTMADLADRGASPAVVAVQVGRLTHAQDLAAEIRHLLETSEPFGASNRTNDGEPVSWVEVGAGVFVTRGCSVEDVTPLT